MRVELIIRIVSVLAVSVILASCGAVSPNDVQLQRARTACEQVGLAPGSSDVSECATNLHATLNNSPL
jgi:hypothetical protein